MAFLLPRLFSIFRAVPPWVWLVAALLGWGAWQKHRAQSVAADYHAAIVQAAASRQADLQVKLTESQRRTDAIQEVAHAADQAASAARSDADRAALSARRLRDRLDAMQADARRRDPAASEAGQTADVTQVLGQCIERYRLVAAAADASIIAGQACQQSYDALTPKN